MVLEHCLFDKQRFYCRQLQTINDDKRIGVLLRGNAIFMYKPDVKIADTNGGVYVLSDGRLTVTINVNNL